MCAAGLMSFTEHGVYVFRLFVLTFCSLLHFDRSCLVPADSSEYREKFSILYISSLLSSPFFFLTLRLIISSLLSSPFLLLGLFAVFLLDSWDMVAH